MGQLLPKHDCMRKCILLQKCKPTYAHLHSQYHLPFHTIARLHVSKITNINFTANQRELIINSGSEINIMTILSTKQTWSPTAIVVIISIIQYKVILFQDKATMNALPSQLSNMYSVSDLCLWITNLFTILILRLSLSLTGPFLPCLQHTSALGKD